MVKICIRCEIEKDINKFYIDKRIKSGYRNKCKKCVGELNKKWRERNKDKVNELNKKWRERNKDKMKLYHDKVRKSEKRQKYIKEWYNNNYNYNKIYYQENKEKISVSKKKYKEKWDKENPDYYKKYNENNKEKIRENKRKWNKKNKNIINEKRKERRRNDNIFYLKHSISSTLRSALKKKGFKKKSKSSLIIGCSYETFLKYIESKFEPWMNWENYGKYNGELNYGWDLDHIIPLSIAETEEKIYELFYYENYQPLCSKINRNIKMDKLNYTLD